MKKNPIETLTQTSWVGPPPCPTLPLCKSPRWAFVHQAEVWKLQIFHSLQTECLVPWPRCDQGPAIQIQMTFNVSQRVNFNKIRTQNTLWLILLFLIGSLWLKVKLRLHRH
jgi:hypothetical protein